MWLASLILCSVMNVEQRAELFNRLSGAVQVLALARDNCAGGMHYYERAFPERDVNVRADARPLCYGQYVYWHGDLMGSMYRTTCTEEFPLHTCRTSSNNM